MTDHGVQCVDAPMNHQPGHARDSAPPDGCDCGVCSVLCHRFYSGTRQLFMTKMAGVSATQVAQTCTSTVQIIDVEPICHELALSGKTVRPHDSPSAQRGRDCMDHWVAAATFFGNDRCRSNGRQGGHEIQATTHPVVGMHSLLQPRRPGAEPCNGVVSCRVSDQGVGQQAGGESACAAGEHAQQISSRSAASCAPICGVSTPGSSPLEPHRSRDGPALREPPTGCAGCHRVRSAPPRPPQ